MKYTSDNRREQDPWSSHLGRLRGHPATFEGSEFGVGQLGVSSRGSGRTSREEPRSGAVCDDLGKAGAVVFAMAA
jgi:hypothetical protein